MFLLLDGITFSMRNCIQMEKMIRIIHPKLEDIIIKINNGLSCRQIISEHIMESNKNLEKAVRARNISPANKKIQHWLTLRSVRMRAVTTSRDVLSFSRMRLQTFLQVLRT